MMGTDNWIVWGQNIFLVIVALLVRRFPNLMAGYNTMTPEQKKNVDARGAARCLCNILCIVAGVSMIAFYVLKYSGAGDSLSVTVATTIIPVVGVIIALVRVQRYDHNT